MFFRRRRGLPPKPRKGFGRGFFSRRGVNKGFSSGFGGGLGGYKSGPPKKGGAFRTFYRLLVCAVIFAFAIFLNQAEDPLGERVASGVQYFLSTENDYQPVIQRVVGLSMKMENVEWPLVSNLTIRDYTEGQIATEGEDAQEAMGSMEERPFQIPISGRIIKRFGEERDIGYQGYHEGIDVEADLGTSVKAAEQGIVIRVAEDQILGNYVVIDHGLEVKTLYGYLEGVRVTEGQSVQRGEVIATVGQSGIAEATKLHFQVREKGELIDPLTKFELDNKGI